MSVHEYRVHHDVSELMNQLGAKPGEGPGAENYTELLMKNMTPYVTTQVSAHNSKKRIAETSVTPMEFLQKYDELKLKNVKELDPMVYLVSKITEDSETKSFLEKNAKDKAAALGVTLQSNPSQVLANLPPTGSKISQQEFSDLRAKLLKESSVVSAHTSSEVLRKVLKEKTSNKHVQIPVQPDWIFQRPHLTMDFVIDHDDLNENNPVPIGTLPTPMQECAVIEDLLYCMEGVEGKYISTHPLSDRYASREFQIDSSLDVSLQELTRRILPLCADYSTVVRFIEEKSAFEYGLVNHALSAAMRTLIKDYFVLVAQLENQHRTGQLTLQKFWFYIQPSLRTMEILASVANSVNKGECIGGAVLSLLHEKTSCLTGDAKGQELCLYLTQAACVPYFEILEKWIYKGIISDPYSEFLVEENDVFSKDRLQEDYNDAYWEQHYSIIRDRIPVFLERIVDKILSTGKYLNVVRQCGRNVQCPHAEEIVYTIKERLYVDHIENAYAYASKVLLQLLLDEKQLMAHLRSIKHYFLLDQGDVIVQFMDMADDELKKTIDDIMPQRLESLLELALRTSTANIDPFKDNLKIDLLNYDLITQLFKILSIDGKMDKDYKIDPTELHLSGLEAFTFDYVVKWPVSLVLNRKALTRYQMLFRHFFYCKHVERQLCSVWISNKSAKEFRLQANRWYASAFALRQRMLTFVQNFEYYMMFEVVEPNWIAFESNMDTVSNLDDILNYHADFLNSCLKECMLTNPDLLKIIHKLMMVCVTFSNFIQRINQSSSVENTLRTQAIGGSTLQSVASASERREDRKKATTKGFSEMAVADHLENQASNESFERTIMKFNDNFTQLLISLLDKIMDITDEPKLMNIVHRIDFNSYYREKLEAASAERSMIEPPSAQRSPQSTSGFPSARSAMSGSQPERPPSSARSARSSSGSRASHT